VRFFDVAAAGAVVDVGSCDLIVGLGKLHDVENVSLSCLREI
jgi:hypothetical protein